MKQWFARGKSVFTTFMVYFCVYHYLKILVISAV
jgi:hypothetical protein